MMFPPITNPFPSHTPTDTPASTAESRRARNKISTGPLHAPYPAIDMVDFDAGALNGEWQQLAGKRNDAF
jgi:hypothetical protein